METASQGWKRCSSCKDWIDFDHPYYVCSVSTCNRKRTALVFCSVSCWEVHVPMMRHRDSGAVEERSPSREAHARAEREEARKEAATPAVSAGTREPKRTIVRRGPTSAPATSAQASSSAPGPVSRSALSDDVPTDVLIVASKLKQYVKARSGMNTSDGVMKVLSDHVRALCDKAIRTADENERKTVMDRDFPKPD